MNQLLKLAKQGSSSAFFRFGCVGILNTLADFIIFFSFFYFIYPNVIIAQIVSFVIVVTQSYIFNKYWSFHDENIKKISLKEYSSFVLASLFTLVVAVFILVIGENLITLWKLKVLATVVTVFISFALYRWVVFPSRKLAGRKSARW